jgi:hypothetical protein
MNKEDFDKLTMILKIVFIMVIIAIVYYSTIDFDKADKYNNVCISGVEYIEGQGQPLVPSYKADGTINTCEGDE